jgi:hypothetical protein
MASRLTLTGEEAAQSCGFTTSSFNAWVRAGLLPSEPANGWTGDLLRTALNDLARDGLRANTQRISTVRMTLPGVQRIRRRLVDGNFREHLRHRKTGRKLPLPIGSPACILTLIECERELARRIDVAREQHVRRHEEKSSSPEATLLVKPPYTVEITPHPGSHLGTLLTPEQLSARYYGQVSIGTLANWRAQRRGPAYLRVGKNIYYPSKAVETWERQNLVLCELSAFSLVESEDEPV